MTKPIRTNKTICLYCFGDLNVRRICTSCGKHGDLIVNAPHDLPVRTVLNKTYLIANTLGEGGFGITYLAWDLTRGIKVAVKEYYPVTYVTRTPSSNKVVIKSPAVQVATNRGLKRFVDEARILQKINTLPGVVSVLNFFCENDTAYIVMEFLDGVSLHTHMKRKLRLSMDDALKILRPVMDSLAKVHSIGLIHRDISPDNILLTKYGHVKLIDFGAAKSMNLDGRSMSVVLKHGFAPPEQYHKSGLQGAWTDIYALGATIYYCLTGKLIPESTQRMVKDTLIKPSLNGAKIAPRQEAALLKMLAVKPELRYRDMNTLIAALYI
ncbi:MAG: serine/threonine protein kinase [Firmicutes bacterium]|nr:serine/threonine protein kinase [Bacillota bacterium]